jgi:regulator of replication initiation timing
MTNKQKPRVYWTEDKLISEIKRLHNDGIKLNGGNIFSNYQYIIQASYKLFGGWANALCAAGFNYDEISTDRAIEILVGRKFEKLLDRLLCELNIQYDKYEHEIYKPDYIFSLNRWGDAKLSEWTIFNSNCNTIENYRSHCKYLTIIYLRGNKYRDEIISHNTRLISVYKLVKQLPKQTRTIYERELNDLLYELEHSNEGIKHTIWNKEKVLKELHKFHNSDPKNRNLEHTYKSLYSACVRYFGSYKKAVELIEKTKQNKLKKKKVYSKRKKNTSKYGYEEKEILISSIKEKYSNHENLNLTYIKNNEYSLYYYGKFHFSSWRNALESCGINYDLIKYKKQAN